MYVFICMLQTSSLYVCMHQLNGIRQGFVWQLNIEWNTPEVERANHTQLNWTKTPFYHDL